MCVVVLNFLIILLEFLGILFKNENMDWLEFIFRFCVDDDEDVVLFCVEFIKIFFGSLLLDDFFFVEECEKKLKNDCVLFVMDFWRFLKRLFENFVEVFGGVVIWLNLLKMLLFD